MSPAQSHHFLVEELYLMKLYSSSVDLYRRSPAVEGPVTALEMNGDGVVEACNKIASEVFSGTKVL